MIILNGRRGRLPTRAYVHDESATAGGNRFVHLWRRSTRPYRLLANIVLVTLNKQNCLQEDELLSTVVFSRPTLSEKTIIQNSRLLDDKVTIMHPALYQTGYTHRHPHFSVWWYSLLENARYEVDLSHLCQGDTRVMIHDWSMKTQLVEYVLILL